MSSAQERGLAMRAAQGDQEAFAEIVHSHQQAVFNVAYRLLGNVRDAEDAAQDAFLRAYQFFDKFDMERPLAPWLKRITTNVCLNRLGAQTPVASLDEDLPPPLDPEPGPEAQISNRQLSNRIRAEILRLPPRYRAVIELRHFQDLRYDEIAQVLERPLSDVKSDLFRARKILAERLKNL
jgi:RNA polymerase sigma-70 factor (ECF subfamily)